MSWAESARRSKRSNESNLPSHPTNRSRGVVARKGLSCPVRHLFARHLSVTFDP
jgi:hypothetical protein